MGGGNEHFQTAYIFEDKSFFFKVATVHGIHIQNNKQSCNTNANGRGSPGCDPRE